MKKFLRLMITAAVSIMSALMLCVMPVAAETTYTITINDTDAGHTYQAYQVFAGDLSNGVLSNITWGTGVNGDALLTALKADKTIGTQFASATDAESAAEVIGKMTDDSASAKALAEVISGNTSTAETDSVKGDSAYTISGLNAGYYFVKDKADSQNEKADAYTRYILKVAENVSVDPKSSVPSVVKKVYENKKYTANEGYGAGYNDVADYNIGDAVPFELTGTLPTNYADYTTYNYVFHDTKSDGLTFNQDSVEVYADDTKLTSTDYTAAFDGNSMTVTFTDLKSVTDATITASTKITVKYTATLNANAVIGLDGNPNEVYLTYSNNPNAGGNGNTGKTPTDKVIVFTYELDTKKVDGTDNTTVLSGAKFLLYRMSGSAKQYAVVADGKVSSWTEAEDKATELVSGTDGLFKIAGLDDGAYYLHESVAPAGYNLLTSDVELTIAATTVNGQNWTSGTASDALTKIQITANGKTADGDTSKGTVNLTVANKKGSTLPSTGGMGTTIFTVGGIALIALALFALIYRSRHTAEKN